MTIVADFGDNLSQKSATVAEFCDCRRFLAVFCDSRRFRCGQCGQGFMCVSRCNTSAKKHLVESIDRLSFCPCKKALSTPSVSINRSSKLPLGETAERLRKL